MSDNKKVYENPYKLYKICENNIHIGNGAKNELKKENKNYNFKFCYKIENKLKFCSAGFDNSNDIINFVKPISKKYFIYEYIFKNKKCKPYFDYEYKLNNKPNEEYLTNNINKVKENIKNCFKNVFKIELNDSKIIITQSHGFVGDKFKVSFHIIIKGYYFESNEQCKYLCEILKENDEYFDSCVYSTDRLMRCVGSSKNWDDNRTLLPTENKFDMKKFNKYLITKVKKNYVKLTCPIQIKKKINKQKYKPMNDNKKNNNSTNNKIKIIDKNELGNKMEQIIQNKYHEDSYFTKLTLINDDITFYTFNYIDRNQKCFTGNKHDNIGFYCWLDNQSNVLLKCFSENCKNCKKVVGNLNDKNVFNNAIKINNKYLNENDKMKELINKFEKTLIIKSNMGTGKTEIVCNYIDKHKPKRILWISTRQTYASNIHERLKKFKFINYLDNKDTFYANNKIIVQLESLHYLNKNFEIDPFDLIVLDEIESILYHFDSSTIAENSKNTFNLLYELCINKTTKIIAMDADINSRSIEYIKNINKNYNFVVNEYISNDIFLNMTNNKDYFINKIKESISKNEKCCIISLSTKLLYQIEEFLIKDKTKYIMHTRDTDDKFKKELTKVNKLWAKYQVVLFSPSITVGLDFTLLHFDKIYNIITSNVASPRTFKQMLGRIRNLKSNDMLTYYQGIESNTDSFLYDYNEMIDYFKYCDNNIKITKKYITNKETGKIEVINDFELYDKIMMYNNVENMNKLSSNFMTQLNLLFMNSNYKITFLNNNIVKDKTKLNDDVYKDKILNSNDIDEDEFENIQIKIMNNLASENDKFSCYKYKFKQFWKLDKVDKKSLELYFRCEQNLYRLLTLFDKEIKNEIEEYNDINIHKKITVVKNIIKTLGFDLKNLNTKISSDDYNENIKKLINKDNDFYKDYDNIRILFNKEKHEIKENINTSSFNKIINSIFEKLGIKIINKRTSSSKNKKIVYYNCFMINIDGKFIKFINKKK